MYVVGSNKVHLTPPANEDLIGIWEYTYKVWSFFQADKYIRMLYTTFDTIATAPTMYGRDYEYIGVGVRGYLVGKHIIIYRIVEDGIEVLRILHQSSNWQTIRLK